MIGANIQLIMPNISSNVQFFPFFFSNQGVYKYHRNIYSEKLKNYRDLVIYTPPSYYENTLKIHQNILLMHDGQNLFNASTAFFGNPWYCQQTIDMLVNEGEMEELIIVGVDNTDNRINEYTYSYDNTEKMGGEGDIYLDFLQNNIIPFVQEHYRVDKNVKFDILGSSLGGLISCYAGWTRNSIWKRAGCMSSSFWWNDEDFNNVVTKKYPIPKNLFVYLDSGDAGQDNDDMKQTIRVRDHLLLDLGFKLNSTLWYYLDHGGMHSETYWGRRFWIPMTDFYPTKLTKTNDNPIRIK